MIEGFYNMAFTGAKGSGFGNLVLSHGTIAGSDAAGASYEGTYQHDRATSSVLVKLVMNAPAGVSPVQTGIPLAAPASFPIEATIPEDFGGGKPVLIRTLLGPVNVAFKKVKDLPA